MSSCYKLAERSSRSCVLCTMSSLLQHPLGSTRILQQLQSLGGIGFDDHSLSQSQERWSAKMPGHAHVFKGAWFWGKRLWLTPCPESTHGRRFPAWLLKCCPMYCSSRICCLRDVNKYLLLFPIMGTGKFQHEAIKIGTDCSSWGGEAVLPLCSVFLCRAAFRHAKSQCPAVVFLVCFCSGGLLPAEQTNPKCM